MTTDATDATTTTITAAAPSLAADLLYLPSRAAVLCRPEVLELDPYDDPTTGTAGALAAASRSRGDYALAVSIFDWRGALTAHSPPLATVIGGRQTSPITDICLWLTFGANYRSVVELVRLLGAADTARRSELMADLDRLRERTDDVDVRDAITRAALADCRDLAVRPTWRSGPASRKDVAFWAARAAHLAVGEWHGAVATIAGDVAAATALAHWVGVGSFSEERLATMISPAVRAFPEWTPPNL